MLFLLEFETIAGLGGTGGADADAGCPFVFSAGKLVLEDVAG